MTCAQRGMSTASEIVISSWPARFSGREFYRPASDGNDRVWDVGVLPSLRLCFRCISFFFLSLAETMVKIIASKVESGIK